MNLILIGLNTIAALLGYNKFGYFEFNTIDLINISNQTNICIKDGKLNGVIDQYDLYTLEGENRYVCFEFENSYLIYDKATDEIDEYNFSVSPYNNYEQNLCVYVEGTEIITHGMVDDKSIYNLDSKSYIDDNLITNYVDNDTEKGEYLLFDDYGTDVQKIKNSYYFENLNEYHGYNSKGTCAIVAI